jgi:hypothetical protein
MMVKVSTLTSPTVALFLFFELLWSCHAFAPLPITHRNKNSNNNNVSKSTSTSTSLSAYASKSRNTILGRNGAHFKLNRFSGKVEFGSTANLITTFEKGNTNDIQEWLSDEKRVALSIWDENLIQDLGSSTYRLQLMTLQFVTIQLAPSVDTRMWIEKEKNNAPVFKLQSIDFDPNIQLLPGLNVPASSLGIQIEVVGELRPSANGQGVEGRIGFVSGGDLPPPMRLLPEVALKSASDVICKTVSDFAVMSFQNGARSKYLEFVSTRQKEKAT